jgi:hypothetical protein
MRDSVEHLAVANGEDQKQAFTQQLVSQLEPLLYLAYRLNLGPLQEALHGFVRGCTSHSSGVFKGHMRSVLNPRVTEAAAGEGLVEEGLLQLLVAQRCSLAGKEDGLFGPVQSSFMAPVVRFKAKLQKPLPGAAVGDVADVLMDLNTGKLAFNDWIHKFQLLVEAPVSTPSSKAAVLGE